MPVDLSKLVDKNFLDKSPKQLLSAPLHALKGVSEKDAELVEKAFRIKTIKGFAESKYVAIAQAITMLAQWWEEALDKEFEDKSPVELVDAPVWAISGVSKNDAKLLEEAFGIRTIRDLATNRFVFAAQLIRALAQLEDLLE